jgi:hypothetical protein
MVNAGQFSQIQAYAVLGQHLPRKIAAKNQIFLSAYQINDEQFSDLAD